MPSVLSLYDASRGRALPTTLYQPAAPRDAPLVVFAHGTWGHPRKFTRLFSRWANEGYLVAAPAFPHTSDENPPPYLKEDVVNQPADISFVIEELVLRRVGDPGRIGVGGFSLGAETALAVGLHPRHANPRVRAVVAVAGGLFHAAFAGGELLPRPLLLVHGSEDESAARELGAAHQRATGPTELLTLDGAGHDICQDSGLPHAARVAEATTAFWDRHLAR